MRLLLAGGTGLIGGEVLRLGLSDGYEITTVGRRPTGMASSEIV
ncbi:MAG: oxidoreductase, partial [Gammaproteobacteria bacterium]|nr:oxidoreductase [Gammaproteobacteria bacterium]